MSNSLQVGPSAWAEMAPAITDDPRPAATNPRVLRSVVMVLALLATAKVGVKEYLFHTASAEVIVAAYRERAAEACRTHPRAQDYPIETPDAFKEVAAASVTIGKPGHDVYLWQTDHPKWDARYRNPYVNLTVPNRAGTGSVVCEYDIVNGRASLRRR